MSVKVLVQGEAGLHVLDALVLWVKEDWGGFTCL
jgi:hypothetical protein